MGYFAGPAFLRRSWATLAAVSRSSLLLLVVLAERGEDLDRRAVGRAVAQRDDASRRTASLPSLGDDLVQERPDAVDHASGGRDESFSSESSAEPRQAGLASSSPRRSSSIFWRKRNCAIARYATARSRKSCERAAASSSSSHSPAQNRELLLVARLRRARRPALAASASVTLQPASARAAPT